MHIAILPDGWKRPKGYSNAIVAEGKMIFVAGQVGWNENEEMVGEDFATQAGQALRNIAAILKAAGSRPDHIVRMTWYVGDKAAYLAALKDLGKVYRDIIGEHYPAMTAIEVGGFVEEGAMVEIEATAVVP